MAKKAFAVTIRKKEKTPFFNYTFANAEMDVRRDRFTGKRSTDPYGDNKTDWQIICEAA